MDSARRKRFYRRDIMKNLLAAYVEKYTKKGFRATQAQHTPPLRVFVLGSYPRRWAWRRLYFLAHLLTP